MKTNLRRNIDACINIGASDVVIEWLKYGIRFPLIEAVQELKAAIIISQKIKEHLSKWNFRNCYCWSV